MAPARSFAEFIAGHLSARRSVLLYTVVRSGAPARFPAGAKIICPEGLTPECFGLGQDAGQELYSLITGAEPDTRPGVRTFRSSRQDAQVAVYCERLRPPLQCVIAGAGHIGRVLAHVGEALGWAVVVIDDRADYADPGLYSSRTRVICAPFSELGARVVIDDATAVVLVTRGHRHDEACLRTLVNEAAFYVGMIGSRRRVATALAGLRAAGAPESYLLRIFAPVGLPLGTETPGEIALAIAAEIVAVWRGREAWARQQKQDYYRT